MKTPKTFLPGFSGYCWGQFRSDAEELETLYLAEQERAGYALDEDDFIRIYFEVRDYGKHSTLLARRFCELFDAHISKAVGFPVGLKFEKVSRPAAEYIFETDRILAKIPVRSVSALYAASKASKHKTLKREIIAEYTSYDGYISHYSNDLDDWLAKPIEEWDPNELRTLLAAFVEPEVHRIVSSSFNKSDFNEAFKKAVDWKKFDRKVAALRRQRG